MLVCLIFCLHWSWTLGISNALTFDRTQLSYGQVLSIFVPIPALWSFCGLLRDCRAEMKKRLTSIPSYIRQGICFTFTGRNDWSAAEIPDRDYFYWSRRRWIISEYQTNAQLLFILLRLSLEADHLPQRSPAASLTWDSMPSGLRSTFKRDRCRTTETRSTSLTKIGSHTLFAVSSCDQSGIYVSR